MGVHRLLGGDGGVHTQSRPPFLRLSESAPCVRHLRLQQEPRFLRLLGASTLQVQRSVLPWSRCDLSARLLDLLLLRFCLISCCRRHNQDQMEEKLNFANVCKFTKSFCLKLTPAFLSILARCMLMQSVVPLACFEHGGRLGLDKVAADVCS